MLRYGDEAIYWTKRVVPEVALTDSELVFVGYGIVEPAWTGTITPGSTCAARPRSSW